MFILQRNSLHKNKPDYHDAVEAWQAFLVGRGFAVEVDGDFGLATEEATKAYQLQHGLTADGIAGNRTLGLAMSQGLDFIDDESDPLVDQRSPNFPPPPTDLHPKSMAQQKAFFGTFAFVATPRPGNPEAIRITDNWADNNIVKVIIPQLIGVNGAATDGGARFHKKVADGARNLFAAWDEAGLSDLVLGWAASWVQRFVRGSTTTLSNHAYGAAFDINVPWNGLGVRPALVGNKGSVRLLVPLANEHGFYWGGHYKNRKDGMHFEFVKY